MDKKRQPMAGGFSLIELLVVIAIITLLMSILLPVLSQAREVAQSTACGSNIRQVTLANTAYARDNQNHFAWAARDWWSSNLEKWHGKRDAVTDAYDAERSDLASYVGSRGNQCPNFVDGDGYQFGDEASSGGYGYNAFYIGGRFDLHGFAPAASAQTARIDDVFRPAATVMFTDAASMISSDFTKGDYSFAEPPFWQISAGAPSTFRRDPSIDFRHMGQANAAWVDGHVDRQDLAFSMRYLSFTVVSGKEAAEQGVGWFGPDDNSLFDLR